MSPTLILAVFAMPQAAPAPPPAIIPTPVPPPVIITTVDTSPRRPDPARPPVPLRIEVRAGDEVIWSDTLRVAWVGRSSYSVTRDEPHTQRCDQGQLYNRARQSLKVSLSLSQWPKQGERLRVNIDWSRPNPEDSCSNNGGSRSVSLEQTVQLPAGATRRIEGDGGLVMTVTRP